MLIKEDPHQLMIPYESELAPWLLWYTVSGVDADLGIHGRVPVGVVEDDGVGAGEVHADAAAARGQDEDEELGVGVVALHQDLALLRLGGAVQAHIGVAVQVQEHLHLSAAHDAA